MTGSTIRLPGTNAKVKGIIRERVIQNDRINNQTSGNKRKTERYYK
ncbi:MAG: hypothetical protein IPI04_19340 [Ignavibacteria bacterium]|nr:hypothetical protein [Ignavibacteria bacterium]